MPTGGECSNLTPWKKLVAWQHFKKDVETASCDWLKPPRSPAIVKTWTGSIKLHIYTCKFWRENGPHVIDEEGSCC